jgi:protein-tyrosine phosphatase
MKILMVCLGNICRSPLAEGILKSKIEKLKLNWMVDSAGTANYHIGQPPHTLSQKVAKEKNIDISKQQCRQFVKEDMIRFDKIYVMDNNNYLDVKNIAADFWNESKVELLLNSLYPNQNKNVPDPWYGEEKDYYDVFELINRACDKVIASLTADSQNKISCNNRINA